MLGKAYIHKKDEDEEEDKGEEEEEEEDVDEEEEDQNKKKANCLFNKDIIEKRGRYDEEFTQYRFYLPAWTTFPNNLNSLIIIGTYFIHYNYKFILTEYEISDNSWNLADHPNFQRLDNELQDLFTNKRYMVHNTKQVIDILQRKFCKYIYMTFLDQPGKSENIYSPLFIPKSGIHPFYNYLILPSHLEKKTNFRDSFEYCYKAGALKKSPKTEFFLKKYSMKYILKWIITINSKTANETSIPEANSILFIRLHKNLYLKYSNHVFSVVSVNDIFMNNYQRSYFCYEKVGKAKIEPK